MNLGTLKGDAVGIFAGTLKHSGVVQATRATLEGGKVVLKAAGDAIVEGTATITATGTTGGSVDVLGKRVGLTDSASIDVSGTSGGGQVRVGGDYQGKNTAVPNAEFAYLGKDVSIKANATEKGNGGRVIVWADDTTRAYSSIEAKGGVNGGDGGFVETSGKKALDVNGARVKATSTIGTSGNWLLDPADVTITSSVSSGATYDATPSLRTLFTPITGNVLIGASDITSALNAGTSVTVTTFDTTLNPTSQSGGSGNIQVSAAVSWSTSATLTLDAYNDITIALGTGSAFSAALGTLRLLAGNRTGATSGAITNASGGDVNVMKAEAVANQNVNLIGSNRIDYIAGKSANGFFKLETASNAGSLQIDSVGGSVGVEGKTEVSIQQYNTYSNNPGISVNQPVKTIDSTGSETTKIWISSGTGNLTQQSGANISGRYVQLRAGNSVNLNADVNAGASGLTAETLNVDAPGGVNQSAGKIVSAGGNSKFLAYNGNSVTVNSTTNDFDRIEVSNSTNYASSITIKDANDVYLKGLNANGAISVVAGGAVKQDAGGGVATSGGGISLSGTSIGATGSGNYVNVSSSSGTVQLTASSGGIYVHNSSGVQTSKYTVSAAGAGQDVNLSGDSVNIDSFANYAGNTNDDVLGFIATTNTAPPISISAIGSKTASKFLFEASQGGSINLGTFTFNGPVKVDGFNYSVAGTPTVSGGNDMWFVVKSGSSNSFSTVTPTFSSGGRWLIVQNAMCDCGWTSNPGGSTEAFRQYGYSNGATIAGSGNGVLNFDSYTLVPSSLSGAVTKVYDGGTSISLSGANVSVNENSLPSLDSRYTASTPLTVSLSGTGALSDPNVGTGKPVSLNANSVLGTVTASDGVKFYGLTMDLQAGVSANIGTVNPARAIATIGLSGARQYDGTNVVNASIFSLGGLVNGETLTLTGAGTVADKNVGVDKPVTLGTLALGNGTGLASNYTLTGGTHKATITAKTITAADLSGLLANTRMYDGTDDASLNLTNAKVNAIGTEVVTLDAASAVAKFDNKNKGVDKVVTVKGLALSGADAKNYAVDATGIVTKGTITAKVLTGSDVTGLAVQTREYDGTDKATLDISNLTVKAFGTDQVSLESESALATFDNRNKGVDKVVTVKGLVLQGADMDNYTLDAGDLKTKGEITVRPLATWKGGASGAWGVAANWDALPDGDNVNAVQIASGTAVSIDGSVAPIKLASLSMPGGNLTISGSSLIVDSGGVALEGYTQTSGAVEFSSGNLSATGQFSQSGGTLRVGGALTANHVSGAMVVGVVNAQSVDLSAASGGISQVGGIEAAGLVKATAQGAVDLSSTSNRMNRVLLASTGAGDVGLVNTGVLTVDGLSTANGSIKVDNTGAITTVGAVVAMGGGIEGIAHSPITIGAGGLSATGNVSLSAPTKDGTSTVTLNGPVRSSNGSVSIQAAKDVVQNSAIYGAKGVAVAADGSLILGANASTDGAPVQYSASGSSVNPPVGVSSVAGSDKVANLVAAFMQSFQNAVDENQEAGEETAQTESGETNKEKKKKSEDGANSGAEICLR